MKRLILGILLFCFSSIIMIPSITAGFNTDKFTGLIDGEYNYGNVVIEILMFIVVLY